MAVGDAELAAQVEAAEAAVSPWTRVLEALVAEVLLALAGGDDTGARAVLLRGLARLRLTGLPRVLRRVVDDGITVGVDGARGADPVLDDILKGLPGDTLANAVRDVTRVRRFTAGGGDVKDATTMTRAAGRRIGTAAGWAATRAVNTGVAAAAEAQGQRLLWVSERGACLACRALAGAVTNPGEPFERLVPVGYIYPEPVRLPPRHPHCQCRVEAYDGPPASTDMSAGDYASALAREARRSIATGGSQYDSQAARLRALDTLLRVGAHLPRTVAGRARRAAARRAFG